MTIFLALCVVFSGCKEDPKIRKRRLKQEVIEIQSAALKAIFKNDLKFLRSLDEDDELFVRIRKDLERCREIEAELREIAPEEDEAQLEEITKGIELIIAKREEEMQRRREEFRKDGTMDGAPDPSIDYEMAIRGVKMAIQRLKGSNHDTSAVEKQLEDLQRAAQDSEIEVPFKLEKEGPKP